MPRMKITSYFDLVTVESKVNDSRSAWESLPQCAVTTSGSMPCTGEALSVSTNWLSPKPSAGSKFRPSVTTSSRGVHSLNSFQKGKGISSGRNSKASAFSADRAVASGTDGDLVMMDRFSNEGHVDRFHPGPRTGERGRERRPAGIRAIPAAGPAATMRA